jgi:hypothetical protein
MVSRRVTDQYMSVVVLTRPRTRLIRAAVRAKCPSTIDSGVILSTLVVLRCPSGDIVSETHAARTVLG